MQLQRTNFRRFLIIFSVSLLFSLLMYTTNVGQFEQKTYDQRINRLFTNSKTNTLCSKRSAKRGLDQHVLSVSAYESNDRVQLTSHLTWNFIHAFVREAKKFYPSWVVRVYYFNLGNKTEDDIKQLEELYDNLDFCKVEDLPVLGNMKQRLPGKMQRFLPAADASVGVFIVRDLDSEIFEREVHAVNEWLQTTNYAFHIMRDNPYHGIPILGGLWGLATNRLSLNDRIKIAKALLPSDNPSDLQQFLGSYSGSGDQVFLSDHIWPIARHNSLTHDSFSCFWSRYIYRTDTRAFPTKREHPSCFVGCPKPCCNEETKRKQDFSRSDQCPSGCRPKEHPDWLFC